MQLGLPFLSRVGGGKRPANIATCVYCGDRAQTRDHVPPKALLHEPWPANLRTVPACFPCNTSWSLDEQYVAIALAHVSSNPQLVAALESGGILDRALAAAPHLDDRITSALMPDGEGRVWFSPEVDRIRRIAKKIAFGLYCLRYGIGRRLTDFDGNDLFGPGETFPQHLIAAQWIWPGLRRKRWTTVQAGMFSFLFAKGWMGDDPPLYCFINFADTMIAVVSCPPPVGRPRAMRLRSKPWT